MSGNTLGVLFRVTTWGESHGPAVGAVVDGCPPGLDLAAAEIQQFGAVWTPFEDDLEIGRRGDRRRPAEVEKEKRTGGGQEKNGEDGDENENQPAFCHGKLLGKGVRSHYIKKARRRKWGGGAGKIPLDFQKSMWKNERVLCIGGWKGAGGFFYEFYKVIRRQPQLQDDRGET